MVTIISINTMVFDQGRQWLKIDELYRPVEAFGGGGLFRIGHFLPEALGRGRREILGPRSHSIRCRRRQWRWRWWWRWVPRGGCVHLCAHVCCCNITWWSSWWWRWWWHRSDVVSERNIVTHHHFHQLHTITKIMILTIKKRDLDTEATSSIHELNPHSVDDFNHRSLSFVNIWKL